MLDEPQTPEEGDSPVEPKPIAEEASPADPAAAPEQASTETPANQPTGEPEKEQPEEAGPKPRTRRKAAPKKEVDAAAADPVADEDNSSQPTLF